MARRQKTTDTPRDEKTTDSPRDETTTDSPPDEKTIVSPEKTTVSLLAQKMIVSPSAKTTTVSPPAVSPPAKKTTVSKPITKPKGKAKRKCTALKRGDSLNVIEAKIGKCNAKVQRLRTKLEDDLVTRMSTETYEQSLADMESCPRVKKLNRIIHRTNTELSKLKNAQHSLRSSEQLS